MRQSRQASKSAPEMARYDGALLAQLSRFAQITSRGAGELLRQGISQRMRVSMKGRIDPVTEFDVKAEKYIVAQIAKSYPLHGILTEEGSTRESRDSFRWIIDPLDGTVNFAHGFPIYCVSVALEFDGEVILGAVYDPERKEMFSAVKGSGALLNKKTIWVSATTRLERALLATGFAYDIGSSRNNNLGYFARMAKRAQGVRRPGSAAIDLCWLAAGRVDAFWELKLHPWDTAAAALIVEEAGGRLSRMDGRPYSIFHADLLASNGHLHNAMIRALHSR